MRDSNAELRRDRRGLLARKRAHAEHRVVTDSDMTGGNTLSASAAVVVHVSESA